MIVGLLLVVIVTDGLVCFSGAHMLACLVHVAHFSGRQLGYVLADHLGSEACPGLGKTFFNCIEPCSGIGAKRYRMKETNQVGK